jgi:fumarate hydratase class I
MRGVRRAYLDPDNKLRASVLRDPAGKRQNSKDNTPAVVHYEIVPRPPCRSDLRGQGAAVPRPSPKFAMLNPSDDLVDWVLKTVPQMGAGWCPPGILGVGIGGTPEKSVHAGQGIADGAGRYSRADRPWAEESRRGIAHRTV